jgi:hypothetical protein
LLIRPQPYWIKLFLEADPVDDASISNVVIAATVSLAAPQQRAKTVDLTAAIIITRAELVS